MTRGDRLRLAAAGMHPDRSRLLVDAFGSPAAVCRAIVTGRVAVPPHAREAVTRPLGHLLRHLDRLKVRAVVRGDDEYPGHLAMVPDAPDVLFVRGMLPADPAVAIVGTRRSTRYGTALAAAYGRAVAAAGWCVVSGLARGIDGSAHQAVVAAGGIGVAVLGSGPDVIYPREHGPLASDLVAGGGALVTEYPPGTPPQGWRFPPRNRIISGLAAAVVVVESPETGGALVTATAALEHGRTVMAVPGDVDRSTSRGCNLLVRDGALPVLDPPDLVAALSLVPGLPDPRLLPPEPDQTVDPVLAALGPAGATLDELAHRTGLPPGELAARVARLEVGGAVRSVDGVVTHRNPLCGPGGDR